jgi:hypothetical protein
MNDDRRLLRNAIRLDVIPRIEQVTGRGIKAPIVRTATNLRADRRELFEATFRAYDEVVEGRPGVEARFDAKALRALSPPMAMRVIRLGAYDMVAADETPWDKRAMDAVLDLARGRPGRRRDLPLGYTARRDRTHVVVTRAERED